MQKRRQGWEPIRWALWVALLLAVPVTSFPHFPFPQALGEALVRPPGLYPLCAILALELFRPTPGMGRVPRLLRPLLAFAAIATALTALALVDPPLALRGQTPFARALRGVATLGIGMAFLLATWRMASSPARLRSSIRWLVIGLSISVLWGLLQGSRLVFRWPYYAPLNAVQRLVSIWDLNLYRVTGFAYEPSWFADQLAVLLLPMLIASLLTGARVVVRRKLGWLVEVALMVAGLICLTLTYSRGGVLTFVLSTVLGLGTAAGLLRDEIGRWFRPERSGSRPAVGRWIPVAARVAAALVVVAGVVLVVGMLATRNEYFMLLWKNLAKVGELPSYFLSLGASTRYALAAAAWAVFQDHPLLGVGLGQSGFYLFGRMPDWALDRNPEMAFLLAPWSWTFPNPKNLWVRLLAETGLVGMLFFVVFLLLCAAASFALLSRRAAVYRLTGLYGMVAVPAVVISGFSLDTLALPTIWIALGLIVAGIEALKADDKAQPLMAASQSVDGLRLGDAGRGSASAGGGCALRRPE